MDARQENSVAEARNAALTVLRHNAHGPYQGLPRTAGWGYPEPYTRDQMIAAFGIAASGDEELLEALRRVLETLAHNQTALGHIPSLAHDPVNLGASDTTPLFLVGLALYRKATGNPDFLAEAAAKALQWMEYQSPENEVLVAQQPTSDWRDEQWVLGYGLFVNMLYYLALRLHDQDARASWLYQAMEVFHIHEDESQRHVHDSMALPRKPYYRMWVYKVLGSERFDLLGNSLAILSGAATPSRARRIVSWVEEECREMQRSHALALDLPPNFFPYILPEDPDWHPRYARFNQPGEYHNGGVWPFICGFYVAALVAAGRQRLAEQKLLVLTELVRPARAARVNFGFNEWFSALDGTPAGQDWQTWSAAMYLYAATAVERRTPPFMPEPYKRDTQP